MNYNPKLVSFDRSAAYVRHRALKNLRENNPVDALELMRRAVEHAPGNREYLLDLAEMYCEMGCHEQSNRILLDMIAQKDAPAECYYGLALNQFGRNDFEAARQALLLYQRYAQDDAYREEAGGLTAEIDFCDAMRKPMNRKLGRAAQVASRACDALKADDPQRACRLFRRSFELWDDQMEMRALYAMALKLCGDEKQAVEQAHLSVSGAEPSVRALCVAAQVFWLCDLRAEARGLIQQAIDARPADAELRLLIFAVGEMDMPAQAADAVKAALREAPHDKNLLHMRAVAMHRAGAADSKVETFWLRILRLDPEDSIARFYHEAATNGRLSENEPGFVYEVPGGEFHRRLSSIADVLQEGLEAAVAKWREDEEFRRLILWAVGTGDENCGRAAMMIIASAWDERAQSALRELLYRGDIPISVKLHALVFLRLQGVDTRSVMPPGTYADDGILPEPEDVLRGMPACERQLVRYAGEVLEVQYGVRPLSALALMWQVYRASCFEDVMDSTQEAAGALAWNYLLQHGLRVPLSNLVIQFRCNKRRLVYYARRMAAVLETQEDKLEDEDH